MSDPTSTPSTPTASKPDGKTSTPEPKAPEKKKTGPSVFHKTADGGLKKESLG